MTNATAPAITPASVASNAFAGAWKSALAFGSGFTAIDISHLIFPHCHTWICQLVGGVVGGAVWAGLHGVGLIGGGTPKGK